MENCQKLILSKSPAILYSLKKILDNLFLQNILKFKYVGSNPKTAYSMNPFLLNCSKILSALSQIPVEIFSLIKKYKFVFPEQFTPGITLNLLVRIINLSWF